MLHPVVCVPYHKAHDYGAVNIAGLGIYKTENFIFVLVVCRRYSAYLLYGTTALEELLLFSNEGFFI